MAAFAPASVGAFQKLAAMGIGLMAIGTIVVGNRSLEVPALMAGQARHLQVFAQQWVMGF